MTRTKEGFYYLYYLDGFNGLVRYNKSNLFNTPFGSYPNHPYFPENEIYFFSEKLENAIFTNLDFEEFIDFVLSENTAARFFMTYLATSNRQI